jgi:hypothetical protein
MRGGETGLIATENKQPTVELTYERVLLLVSVGEWPLHNLAVINLEL